MPDVTMPRLSDSMEEGTILKWLKDAGDEVAKGEELVEIETDKATMTYEADADGTLEIVAEEGSTLSIGEVIARIGEGAGSGDAGGAAESSGQEASAEGDSGDDDGGDGGGTATKTEESDGAEESGTAEAEDDGEAADEDDGEEEDADEADEQPAAEEDEAEEPQASANGDGDRAARRAARRAEAEAPAADGNGGRAKASPVARRIAREHGIDLSTLEGTGPGGRIVKADVEAAASGGDGESETAEPEESETREPELAGRRPRRTTRRPTSSPRPRSRPSRSPSAARRPPARPAAAR